jgi:hypothetical protein
MNFCQYSRDWLYEKGCKNLLSQWRRARKERKLKQYFLIEKNNRCTLCAPCASAREQDVKPAA